MAVTDVLDAALKEAAKEEMRTKSQQASLILEQWRREREAQRADRERSEVRELAAERKGLVPA